MGEGNEKHQGIKEKLVSSGMRRSSEPGEPVRDAVLWCLAAGAVAAYVPPLACFAGAFGTSLATQDSGFKRVVIALVSLLVPSVALSVAISGLRVTDTVVSVLVGFAFGILLTSRHLTGNSVCLVGAASVAALIVGDALAAQAAGQTLPRLVHSAMTESMEEVTRMYPQAPQQSLAEIQSQVSLYWPLLYGVVSVIYEFCAWLGITMFTRPGAQGAKLQVCFRNFRAPIWIFVCACGGFAVYAASRYGISVPTVVNFCAMNLLQGARFMLVLDGLACMIWLMDHYHVRTLGRVFATIVALEFEYGYFVMSVFGLVDRVADFRVLVQRLDSSDKAHKTKM